jgi:catalase-peroxidase
LERVLSKLEALQEKFNQEQRAGKKVSLADLIVLGGSAAVEAASRKAGHRIKVPFTPGRTDATQEQTDVESFSFLEPVADGFRNYARKGLETSAPYLLVDKAQLLTLTAPEMTVLVGGMRMLGANFAHSTCGVFTERHETLTADFFVNLLDMRTKWQTSETTAGVLGGHDRRTGALKWTATTVDLVFGSNSQLRAVSEVYASIDGQQTFIEDFVSAWTKVMNLDRFDLA